MAVVLTSSNSSASAGKWNPYYCKPFYLGDDAASTVSTDGGTYITHSNVVGSSQDVSGLCLSSDNCGFYYVLVFANPSGVRFFYVKKYDLNDVLVDTIYASETGESDDGKWWANVGTKRCFTIDIGVVVQTTGGSFSANDEYTIRLPNADTMDRRRIYHGGYSTFLRMPETEGKAYHSDILPLGLKGRNITTLFNPNFTSYFNLGVDVCGLRHMTSKEDTTGNRGVSLALEWNGNKDGATSSTAGGTDYSWGAGETWHLGSLFVNDLDVNDPIDVNVSLTNFPSSDMTAATTTTGATQDLNTTVSGRSGYARMRLEYMTGAGSPSIMAFNQFWQIILIIS